MASYLDRPDVTTSSRAGQTYKFGWLVAWSGLANAANPKFIGFLGYVLGPWGAVLGVLMAGWSLAIGVAAAAVRPWSWYVLLTSPLFGLAWGGLYATLIARDWGSRAVVGVFSLAMSVVCFSYFYKRRALFRAAGRWQRLERSWPGLDGPATLGADARPGFSGLSPLHRRLFVAALLAWLVIVVSR